MNSNDLHDDAVRDCMERLGLAALRCKPDGSLVDLTTNAAQMLGFPSADEARAALCSPADLWQDPTEIARWLGEGAACRAPLREFAVNAPDGGARTLYLHCANAPVRSGSVEEVLLVAMDPTGMTEQHERRVQMARLESVGAACGAIGHKLNNVLAGFLGYVTLLRRAVGTGSASVQRYLDSLDETSQRTQELAHQLLVIAQKNISYSMQATDAVALVRQAVEHAAKVRAEVPVTLEEPAALPTVEADANALREALQDLILGAAAVLPGTQQIAVTLTAETVDAHGASLLGIQPGDHIRVRIRHSHAATRPIVRERLFDPYYTHDGKGKGAELSLGRAWGIVAVHKGTIAVTPQSPEATVTDIFLPVLGHVQGRKHAGTVGE